MAPDLSEGDMALVTLAAEKAARTVIEEHVKTCPWAQKFKLMAAIFLGAGVGGGGLGAYLIKVIM
jgi:hypothetical protein